MNNTNNLCCVLDPYVDCTPCKGIWCQRCWCSAHEMQHPESLKENRWNSSRLVEPRTCLNTNKKVQLSEGSKYPRYTFTEVI